MKHILITGGAGFIGSRLTEVLLQNDNYKVTCIDNFDPFYPRRQKQYNLGLFSPHPHYTFIEGDIRTSADLEKAGKPDTIVHLAAKAGVRPSIADPLLYEDVNVKGTQVLLEFARQNGVEQFVFASSSSVYGVNKQVPWKETEPLMPISPYAATKLSGEMMGHVYSHLYGLRFIALRFFTVYGPGQRPDLAIHKFFRHIAQHTAIPVYGDGSTGRDYTYVDDIVDGIVAAVNYKDSLYEIINIGNHNTISLSGLISAIESTCGKKALIDRQPQQPGDVPLTFADVSKAERLLNYRPSTPLDKGLTAFYDWFKDYYRAG